MKHFFNKGQGALEYLIIIGAAILVAVIVVSLIISVSRSNSDTATESQSKYGSMMDSTIIQPLVTNVDCNSTAVSFFASTPEEGITGYLLTIDGTPAAIPCGQTAAVPPATTPSGTADIVNPITCTINSTTVTGEHRFSLMALKGTANSAAATPGWDCNVSAP